MPFDRRLGVVVQPFAALMRNEIQAPTFTVKVLVVTRLERLLRMAKPDPRAQLLPQLAVQFRERLLATDRREVVTPAANNRIERVNKALLPVVALAAYYFHDLATVTCDGLTARFDDRLVTAL